MHNKILKNNRGGISIIVIFVITVFFITSLYVEMAFGSENNYRNNLSYYTAENISNIPLNLSKSNFELYKKCLDKLEKQNSYIEINDIHYIHAINNKYHVEKLDTNKKLQVINDSATKEQLQNYVEYTEKLQQYIGIAGDKTIIMISYNVKIKGKVIHKTEYFLRNER